MRLLMICIAALLGGCVATPQSVVTSGEEFGFASTRSTEAVAGCIARNAERHSDTREAIIRHGTTERREVIIRTNLNRTLIRGVAHVDQVPGGSSIIVYVDDQYPPPERGPLARAWVKGC